MKIGANYHGRGRCDFFLWAPQRNNVHLKILGPEEKIIPMEQQRTGYWSLSCQGITPDSPYLFILDNELERPDPASFFQPQGVHNPSQIIDHSAFKWTDTSYKPKHLSNWIIYEMHIGTFSAEGTFSSAQNQLAYLENLGINAIEIMPVSQFPGERNWGYDGVHPFAVQNSYGGPTALKHFVNLCHEKKIAVILDVVYNHLGPEGNYLADFGPYFTDKYETPWGKAINFDGDQSEAVRNYFIENTLYWLQNYHIDALRLDAVYGIYDKSPKHFLSELSEKVRSFNTQNHQQHYLIAETHRHDQRVTKPHKDGGHGFDSQWLDDFHHSIRTYLTQDKKGYFWSFGSLDHIAQALQKGFVNFEDYSESSNKDPHQFIVFTQNHDQVGNRLSGERLSRFVGLEEKKLFTGTMLLSPFVPFIFMGEEFACSSPFLYFVSHLDPVLVQAVREGRKKEFESFQWQKDPPDPQDPNTFIKSKIAWTELSEGHHKMMHNFYRELIRHREQMPRPLSLSQPHYNVHLNETKKLITIKRQNEKNLFLTYFNFNDVTIELSADGIEFSLKKIFDSADIEWAGPGSLCPEKIMPGTKILLQPYSCAHYQKELFTIGNNSENQKNNF